MYSFHELFLEYNTMQIHNVINNNFYMITVAKSFAKIMFLNKINRIPKSI